MPRHAIPCLGIAVAVAVAAAIAIFIAIAIAIAMYVTRMNCIDGWKRTHVIDRRHGQQLH